MAVTLISLSGFSWSIATAETGCNVAKLDYEAQPEINEWVSGINGEAIGKVVGDPMGKLSLEGETSSTNTGVMAVIFTTAFIPANAALFALFGRSAGGWYADSGKLNIERGVLQKIALEFSSRFQVN